MKNFIFKSPKDFHKIVFNKLETIQTEQRHQRFDLADIKRMLRLISSNYDLQSQVDEYFDEDEHELTHTTHPRTKSEDTTEDGSNNGN